MKNLVLFAVALMLTAMTMTAFAAYPTNGDAVGDGEGKVLCAPPSNAQNQSANPTVNVTVPATQVRYIEVGGKSVPVYVTNNVPVPNPVFNITNNIPPAPKPEPRPIPWWETIPGWAWLLVAIALFLLARSLWPCKEKETVVVAPLAAPAKPQPPMGMMDVNREENAGIDLTQNNKGVLRQRVTASEAQCDFTSELVALAQADAMAEGYRARAEIESRRVEAHREAMDRIGGYRRTEREPDVVKVRKVEEEETPAKKDRYAKLEERIEKLEGAKPPKQTPPSTEGGGGGARPAKAKAATPPAVPATAAVVTT